MTKKSEFGQGFTYNFFLFAKHWWKCSEEIRVWEKMRVEDPGLFSEKDAVSFWFNGAADHFYDLEIPEQWRNHKIGRLTKRLQNKGLRWRMEELGDKKDFDKFFEDCERLMRMVDKELGVEVKKATWS